MARNQKFVPPPERVDDLTVWEKALDVPIMLRDVFRYFFIREHDLNLKEPINVVMERFARGSDQQKQEARKTLAGLQLVILNLMLFCSGYDHGKEGGPEFIAVGVKSWDTQLLTGDDMFPRNFGNFHETSRQAPSQKFETPISPSEGWMFRMIDFKDNFLKVVQSLTYYNPKDPDKNVEEITRKLNSPEAEHARRCIAVFLKPEVPVQN